MSQNQSGQVLKKESHYISLALARQSKEKNTKKLSSKNTQGFRSNFQERWALVPIIWPFLESKLIFTFLKNPKKSAFKNESKYISRVLARLSKKKTQENQLHKNCSTTLTKRTRPIIKPFLESTRFMTNLPKKRSTCK